MKTLRLLICGAIACLAVQPAWGGSREELTAQVRAAETGFARSMAERDTASFAGFIAEETVFFGSKDVLRGRAQVVLRWKAFFEGEQAPFSWRPEEVEVLDSGTLALTSGPVHDPEGQRIGTFNSVWRLEADGRWRVVFDKGCPPCESPSKP
jgi:ketosteroid isomerase-like protein